MFKLGDTVLIKNVGLVGEICDINDGWACIEVDPDKLNGIKPEWLGRLFHRKLEDLVYIKSISDTTK
ncbi:MAG: hypothetical protein J6I96_05600 [Oscillospiraceae bacterium]|nr:hypothetical protein [Oscillospiraceae bacterium]